MQDMLVRLYDLPAPGPVLAALDEAGVRCRRAESFERSAVLQFVAEHWPQWSDEVAAAFHGAPPTVYTARRGTELLGFAAYHATRPNFFGPTAVLETERRRGIGRALLLQCLDAMRGEGYAYAIIGGVGPAAYYENVVDAIAIPGSNPGIYGGTLIGTD